MSTDSILLLAESGLIAWAGLSALYVIALIVGGGLILVSVMTGGDDGADVEADADLDLDLGTDFDAGLDGDFDMDMEAPELELDGLETAHAGAGHLTEGFSIAEWLSMRFFVFFAATFGLIGTVMDAFSGYATPVVLAAALAGGVLLGQAVHQTVRYLKLSGGNAAIDAAEYLRKAARVTVAIVPPHRGEIVTQVRGRTRYVPAIAKRPDDHFGHGQRVAIVGMKNGTAEVISRTEFVALTEKDPE